MTAPKDRAKLKKFRRTPGSKTRVYFVKPKPGKHHCPLCSKVMLEIPASKPISILGGAFVGLLAGISNMTTGSLVSGIGILLTVGIVYRLYEELAREQVLESNILMKKLLG